MKDTTRTGKILMFMGLSSVLITWMFVILVLIAGRHLSKVITGISASVSGWFVILVLIAGRHLSKVITGISASVSGWFVILVLIARGGILVKL